jgi:hypothetical protein
MAAFSTGLRLLLVKRPSAEYTFEARGKGLEAKDKFVFPNVYRLMPIAYDRPCSSGAKHCSATKLHIYELETNNRNMMAKLEKRNRWKSTNKVEVNIHRSNEEKPSNKNQQFHGIELQFSSLGPLDRLLKKNHQGRNRQKRH